MKRLLFLALVLTAGACAADGSQPPDPSTPTPSVTVVTTTPVDPGTQPGHVLADARVRWDRAGMLDYDYSFTRICFCLEDYLGPFEVSVRDGRIAAAALRGTDVLDIETLEIATYEDVVLTIDDLFAEVERALRDAASITVQYDPVSGFPAELSIDWATDVADDEIGYQVADLSTPSASAATCSTSGWDVALLSQPDLPEPVAATRLAIFDAAMQCDFAALVALAEVGDSPLATTFGGSGPEIFEEAERRGDQMLRALVEHLNLPPAADYGSTGTTYYSWPSAFGNMTSANGDGIPAAEYEALLVLYSLTELEDMFDAAGGYVGWRNGIAADGEWMYFIAGD
jgi:hypothetical protein